MITTRYNFQNEPFIIAGPCSAESREQLEEVAAGLSEMPEVKAFRAGIWKPRTRPNGFEGVGLEGLQWLQEIKIEYKLPLIVEVAHPEHIDACLKAGIDMLWIGARTTGNPFSVQELSEALKGVDVPVFVKNPPTPDVKLWIGALERFLHMGVHELTAIHRGFHTFDNKPYRNAPLWEIPIELKRVMPQIPIICDPSHICGIPDYIASVSQKALDLEMQGLMIEVHPNPRKALTDAKQQLNILQFRQLMSMLVFRSACTEKPDHLEELRASIDELDDEFLRILSRRFQVITEMGILKRDQNLTILQLDRWNTLLNDRLQKGTDLGIDSRFILRLLEIIHDESIRLQEEVMNRKGE